MNNTLPAAILLAASLFAGAIVPADKITVKVYNGSARALVDRQCFMSYGLLNTLVRIVGDINRIGVIDIDPDIGAEVLDEVLVPRTASGKRQTPDNYESPDLPAEAAEAIFDWVKDHVLSFFVRRLSKTADLFEVNKANLTQIGSFLNGSPDSASNTPSSGALESNPAA